MENTDKTNGPDWEKVLAVLNQEGDKKILSADEECLLTELRQIKSGSEMYADSVFFDTEAKWQEIKRQLNPPAKKNHLLWTKYAAALFLVFVSIWIFYPSANHLEHPVKVAVTTFKPGGNKAVLTLSNGQKIDLSSVSSGQLAQQAGILITKLADGELIYTVEPSLAQGTESLEGFNVIETPKGGQYQIKLPDGTKVWLNAASTLVYPVNFAAHKERNIQLKGEAYFEVAYKKNIPFKVKTSNQEVEVLGTHFNINSYANDGIIETALLEGAVKIRSRGKNGRQRADVFLKPGQLAFNNQNDVEINVINVNLENKVAWTNGYFIFNNENIKNIMSDLARWYDFDVVYQGDVSKVRFHGNYLRSRDLGKLLKAIELTNKVSFKIEGRRITVTQQK